MPALCWFVSVLSSQRQTRQALLIIDRCTYLRQALSIKRSRQEHVVSLEEAVCRFRIFACLRRVCTCTYSR
jgi:hypothetical protein